MQRGDAPLEVAPSLRRFNACVGVQLRIGRRRSAEWQQSPLRAPGVLEMNLARHLGAVGAGAVDRLAALELARDPIDHVVGQGLWIGAFPPAEEVDQEAPEVLVGLAGEVVVGPEQRLQPREGFVVSTGVVRIGARGSSLFWRQVARRAEGAFYRQCLGKPTPRHETFSRFRHISTGASFGGLSWNGLLRQAPL